MDWSPDSARNAYLDTLKLCGAQKEKHNSESCSTSEPESKEFISGLAAGMNAQLIVEVATEASPSTVALAAAARQTGGKLVCIVPEPKLDQSQQVVDSSGLKDVVELKTGDPADLLASYKNIDFSLVDCEGGNYEGALEALGTSPGRAVVVKRVGSMKLSMRRKGVDEALDAEKVHSRSRSWGSPDKNGGGKSKWVTKIDAKTGEKHIFRVTK